MQKHRRHRTPNAQLARHELFITNLFAVLGPAVYAHRVDGMVKIGFTGNLKNRLANLGGFSGILAFRLNATIEDEREIHKRLRGRAVQGREWYAADDPEVLAVVNEMRDELGLSLLEAA